MHLTFTIHARHHLSVLLRSSCGSNVRLYTADAVEQLNSEHPAHMPNPIAAASSFTMSAAVMPQQQEAKEQLTSASSSIAAATLPHIDNSNGSNNSFVYEEVEIDDNAADTEALDALLDQPLSDLSASDADDDTSPPALALKDQRAVQHFLVGLKAYKQHKAQHKSSPPPLLPPLVQHLSTAAAASSPAAAGRPGTAAQPIIDTFAYISTLLARTNLPNSLAVFQTEWNDSITSNPLNPTAPPLDLTPDLHTNILLHTQLTTLQQSNTTLTQQLTQLTTTLHQLRHQRDYHRLHHRRTVEEKARLERDLKRLEAHYKEYEPLIERMKREVERGGRERTMMRMEREKMKEKVRKLEQETERLQAEVKQKEKGDGSPTADDSRKVANGAAAAAGAGKTGTSIKKRSSKSHKQAAAWPPPPSPTNPFATSTPASTTHSQQTPAAFSLTRTFAGHQAAVSALSFHPTRSLLLTASDDCSWKLWTAPRGELVLTGEGHRAWVSDVKIVGGGGGGKVVVSGSGDGLVKVWDLLEARCVSTFGPGGSDSGSSVGGDNAVWSVDVHCTGDHILASYLDGACKVFDLATGTVRSTLRGHVDAVNTAAFLPLSASVLTASADHTLSLWDLRSAAAAGTAQPFATLSSHTAAVMSACVTLSGFYAFSVDVGGRLLQWDLRQRRLLRAAESVGSGLLDVAVDCREQWVLTGGEDGIVRCWDAADSSSSGAGLACVKELVGHEGRVDCVEWEPSGAYVVSGGADHTFRIWS